MAKPLQHAVQSVFAQLGSSLESLTAIQYVQPCTTLSNHSIGQHVRHIIELFQCLNQGYETGTVVYDERKRDPAIENDKILACLLLNQIGEELGKPDKTIRFESNYDRESETPIILNTSYYRELLFNLEHTLHHMAIIRIGITEISSISVSEDFGVATSTIKYRKQCVR